MVLLQFQFTNINDYTEEKNIFEGFCKWICEQIAVKLDTKMNMEKIKERIDYLYQVPWITWKKKQTTPKIILNTISKSLTYKQLDKNNFRLEINENIMLPNTKTSIDRIVRFLEYGDGKDIGTSMFNKILSNYSYNQLDNYYKLYCIEKLNYYTDTVIVGENRG